MKLDFLVVEQCSFNKTAQQHFLKLHEQWATIYWQKSNQYIWFGFRVGRKHKNLLKHCILDKNKINPHTLSRMKLKLHLGRASKMNLNWILERPSPIRCIIQWLLHIHPSTQPSLPLNTEKTYCISTQLLLFLNLAEGTIMPWESSSPEDSLSPQSITMSQNRVYYPLLCSTVNKSIPLHK